MNLPWNKKKNQINYMDLTPYRKHKHEMKDDGSVNVLIPRFKSEWAKKMLIPKNKSLYIRANLDDLGSETWLLIDGDKKVGQIANSLYDNHDQDIEQIAQRLTQWLTQLYHNGFIAFKELKNKKSIF